MTPIIESNKKWIVSFLIFDFLFLGYLAFPERNIDLLLTHHIMKATTILLPLPAWLLSTLLPSNIKEILVFWRIKDPLPGSQAFTIHAPADNRINLDKLEEKIGKFPKCKKEQNALWYKLYRQVRSDISVISSHKSYLLFREICAISAILTFVVPAFLYFSNENCSTILISFFIFAIQYILTSIGAKNSGIRFVRNVLAVYSSQ